MQKHFEREIEHLKESLMKLTTLVEETVVLSTQAFRDMDAKGAAEVVERDELIDKMEIKVEEECLKLLALYQPVAGNLRAVVTILKINNDLERIGDLAVNIAKCSVFLSQMPKLDIHFHFSKIIEKTRQILKKSLDCIVNLDVRLAYEVTQLDDAIDNLKREQEDMIVHHMKANPEHADLMIRFLSVSRYLERIADHATNIAEDIIYSVNGEIIRHSQSK